MDNPETAPVVQHQDRRLTWILVTAVFLLSTFGSTFVGPVFQKWLDDDRGAGSREERISDNEEAIRNNQRLLNETIGSVKNLSESATLRFDSVDGRIHRNTEDINKLEDKVDRLLLNRQTRYILPSVGVEEPVTYVGLMQYAPRSPYNPSRPFLDWVMPSESRPNRAVERSTTLQSTRAGINNLCAKTGCDWYRGRDNPTTKLPARAKPKALPIRNPDDVVYVSWSGYDRT